MKDRFKHAEDEYVRLKELNASGQLTQEQFDVLLKELRVQDAQGRWLMIGADSGKWYVQEGGQWVEADPSATQLTTPRPPSGRLPVIAIGMLVVVLLALGGIFVAASQGLVNIGGISKAPTFVAVSTITPAATATTLPTAAAVLPTVSALPTVAVSLPTVSSPPTATSFPTAVPPPAASATLPPTAIVPSASPLPPSSTPPPATPTVTPRIPTPLSPTPQPSPTLLPSATPTTAIAPGVYVTSLRSDPATPKSQQYISFYATFVNSTGSTIYYRWCVEIWDPNSTKKNSFGITSCQPGTIPAGTQEIMAGDNTYHIAANGGCLPFRARAIWIDASNARIPFLQPDGSTYWYNFQVCPGS